MFFFKAPIVTVFYKLDFVNDAKSTNYVRNRIIKVAQKLRSEGLNITFAVSNAEDFKPEIEEHGLQYKADKKLILGLGSFGEKYTFTGEYSLSFFSFLLAS